MSNIETITSIGSAADLAVTRDLNRNVYGVLGIPIDVTDMADVLHRVDAALRSGATFFISTANLNFLATSLTDDEFRRSLLFSDLCTADGMPIVWIAKLLGIPIKARIAGADIFEALKGGPADTPVKVFFFGGPEGVAAAACDRLNANRCGVICVGSYYPGFGTVEEMSSDAVHRGDKWQQSRIPGRRLGGHKRPGLAAPQPRPFARAHQGASWCHH